MATQNRGRWVKKILMLTAFAGALAWGIWYLKEDHSEPPQYQTAKVSRGEIIQSVTASGTLNPVLNVQVGSQVSGNILKLFADFNTTVKSNQVVAQLDPSTFQAIMHQSEGDLANAKAGLELAQLSAKRSAELIKNKLVPESDNEKALADLHQAEAQVKIKQAALERAQVDLERCTIYAPVDGIVISRNVDVGQTVAASMNAPTLFIIANDLSKMQIDANVSEADVGTVEEGQKATFSVDAFPSRTFNGEIVQIRNFPSNVQNVVTYDTVIGVKNDDKKLKPGMTATVAINTAQRAGALRVPNAALRFKPLEPSTNQTFVARWLGKIGLGKETKSGATNAPPTARPGGTNKTELTENGQPPLTGNEPPEELMKRVREMRDRGEEPPPEIRAKLRELFQSGALQRPGGGGGGPGGGGGGGGGAGGSRNRPAMPTSRTVYVLAMAAPPGGGEPVPTPEPLKVKTGISDGTYTEVTDGLKEGDTVIIGMKLPQAQASAPPAGGSPFGGGGGGGGRRGF